MRCGRMQHRDRRLLRRRRLRVRDSHRWGGHPGCYPRLQRRFGPVLCRLRPRRARPYSVNGDKVGRLRVYVQWALLTIFEGLPPWDALEAAPRSALSNRESALLNGSSLCTLYCKLCRLQVHDRLLYHIPSIERLRIPLESAAPKQPCPWKRQKVCACCLGVVDRLVRVSSAASLVASAPPLVSI